MELLGEIQGQLAELQRIKEKRREAVNRHYRKWIKEEVELTDVEKEIAKAKRERRKEYQAIYYQQNQERAKEYAKSRYVKKENREKPKTPSSSE